MARPSDISTKVVSFRVPMKDYIKLLTLATEKGLSISDYLLMKVYGPDGEIAEGKPLAGTEPEPTARQEPEQSPKVIPESVPELKQETETTLSGVPKKPNKRRSTQKATKATSKATKAKTAPKKPSKAEIEAKRKAEALKAKQQKEERRKALQAQIKDNELYLKERQELAKPIRDRLERGFSTAGTKDDRPKLQALEFDITDTKKHIAEMKAELKQLG